MEIDDAQAAATVEEDPAAAGVKRHPQFGPGRQAKPMRQRFRHRDADNRDAPSQPHAVRQRDGRAQPGEAAGPNRDRDGVERGRPDQGVRHGRELLGAVAAIGVLLGKAALALQDGRGARAEGCVQGEDTHGEAPRALGGC